MSIFSKRIKQRTEPAAAAGIVELRSGFSAFSGAAYENAIFRGAVDTIAKHAAKLKPRSVPAVQRLDRLLQTEPNPYMSAYDLLYKTATAYFCDNNAFILIHRDESESLRCIRSRPQAWNFCRPGHRCTANSCSGTAKASPCPMWM